MESGQVPVAGLSGSVAWLGSRLRQGVRHGLVAWLWLRLLLGLVAWLGSEDDVCWFHSWLNHSVTARLGVVDSGANRRRNKDGELQGLFEAQAGWDMRTLHQHGTDMK